MPNNKNCSPVFLFYKPSFLLSCLGSLAISFIFNEVVLTSTIHQMCYSGFCINLIANIAICMLICKSFMSFFRFYCIFLKSG